MNSCVTPQLGLNRGTTDNEALTMTQCIAYCWHISDWIHKKQLVGKATAEIEDHTGWWTACKGATLALDPVRTMPTAPTYTIINQSHWVQWTDNINGEWCFLVCLHNSFEDGYLTKLTGYTDDLKYCTHLKKILSPYLHDKL